MAKEILTNLRTTQRVELTVKDRLGSRQQEQQCERADDEKASRRESKPTYAARLAMNRLLGIVIVAF
jgi:hypothetical protein